MRQRRKRYLIQRVYRVHDPAYEVATIKRGDYLGESLGVFWKYRMARLFVRALESQKK